MPMWTDRKKKKKDCPWHPPNERGKKSLICARAELKGMGRRAKMRLSGTTNTPPGSNHVPETGLGCLRSSFPLWKGQVLRQHGHQLVCPLQHGSEGHRKDKVTNIKRDAQLSFLSRIRIIRRALHLLALGSPVPQWAFIGINHKSACKL